MVPLCVCYFPQYVTVSLVSLSCWQSCLFFCCTPAVVVIKTLRTILFHPCFFALGFYSAAVMLNICGLTFWKTARMTGNVPVIGRNYKDTSQDMAVHRPGKGTKVKRCRVHTKLLFQTEVHWTLSCCCGRRYIVKWIKRKLWQEWWMIQ